MTARDGAVKLYHEKTPDPFYLFGAFVIEAKSKDEVTALVGALPASSIMKWQVTPIETFAHRADIEKKIVQGLRAQK